jgi:hypothetical protein
LSTDSLITESALWGVSACLIFIEATELRLDPKEQKRDLKSFTRNAIASQTVPGDLLKAAALLANARATLSLSLA